MLIPSLLTKSRNRRKPVTSRAGPSHLFNPPLKCVCLRQKPSKTPTEREKKNRPQDNLKWEIKSGRKPCKNLLKNRFFSFKNVIKKYECFCDLLPSLFYKLSATQRYRTVRGDGWGLLIIFTEEQNSPCYMLLLKRWGYSESTFISS